MYVEVEVYAIIFMLFNLSDQALLRMPCGAL